MPEATWIPGIPEFEASASVELVRVVTRDGVGLAGMLRKPKEEGASRLGVDLVLLMHGTGGNFYGPGMFWPYGGALLEQGCAVLRVNNRGHDAVSVSGGKLFGAAYEIIDDCRYDWEAWIDFAEAAGCKRIGLWGHSEGALKSIYYMSVQHDTRVKCVIAASPPRWNFDAYATMKPEGEEFKQDYARVKQRIDEGRPEALIGIKVPIPLLITAGVWMQKYGPGAKYDHLGHIPKVRVPLLLMIGTQEEQDITAMRGVPPLMEKLAGELEHLTFELIPGADHNYSGQRQYVWGVVSRWLKAVMGLPLDTQPSEFPEYKLTHKQLARFVGTYREPPRGLRFYLQDGVLYVDAEPVGDGVELVDSVYSQMLRQSFAARPCTEDAVLAGEGDGQRVQFLVDRDGAVWALMVGPFILRKVD